MSVAKRQAPPLRQDEPPAFDLRSAGRPEPDTLPRVLQLGPLDSPHLRRWCEAASAAGAEPLAAGHLRRGMRPVELGDVCGEVHRAALPAAPSSRAAERRLGARGRELAALLQLGEVPLRVAWLRHLCRRIRPDLVHAHILDGWGLIAALAGCCPLVVSAWGSDHYLRRGARRQLAAAARSRADLLTAPSPQIAAALGARARHIDLGVELDRFRPPSDGERAEARAALGLGPEPVIVSFRAPTALYRLDLVLDGFDRLRHELPAAKLLLAHGALPLPAPLARRIAATPRVRVLGHVEHRSMPQLLSAADAGISVPTSDASPRSVWECLASGVPVVLSALPQLQARLAGPDEGALFADPRPDSVAACLRRALSDPAIRAAARSAGRERVRAEADAVDHRCRLATAYRALLATGGRSGDLRRAAA